MKNLKKYEFCRIIVQTINQSSADWCRSVDHHQQCSL